MARRGGFRTQAPRTVTVVISGVLWLIGTLDVLGFAQIVPSPWGVYSLIAAGLLLLLGSLIDGL
jgi:hypothetical protein